MQWDEFLKTAAAEFARLRINDRDARFLGYDEPDQAFLDELARLPDGCGPTALYRHFGVDLAQLQIDEQDWANSPPSDA